jgi:hypothetical protein
VRATQTIALLLVSGLASAESAGVNQPFGCAFAAGTFRLGEIHRGGAGVVSWPVWNGQTLSTDDVPVVLKLKHGFYCTVSPHTEVKLEADRLALNNGSLVGTCSQPCQMEVVTNTQSIRMSELKTIRIVVESGVTKQNVASKFPTFPTGSWLLRRFLYDTGIYQPTESQ